MTEIIKDNNDIDNNKETLESFDWGLILDEAPGGFWKKFIKFGDVIEKILLSFATICLFVFLGIIALDVFMREFFTPILWGQEISLFTFMWSTFTAAAVVYRRKEHLIMDILPDFSKKLDFIIKIIVFILRLIFVYIFITAGWRFSLLGIQRVSRPSGFPLIYSFISIPVSGVGMFIFSIEQIYTDIINHPLIHEKQKLI